MTRVTGVLAALVIVAGCAACGSPEDGFRQDRQKVESLEATSSFIAQSYAAGGTSSTYTRTALERTLQLVEEERSALGESADTLADPRGAVLSQRCEHLSRFLADLAKRVERRP